MAEDHPPADGRALLGPVVPGPLAQHHDLSMAARRRSAGQSPPGRRPRTVRNGRGYCSSHVNAAVTVLPCRALSPTVVPVVANV